MQFSCTVIFKCFQLHAANVFSYWHHFVSFRDRFTAANLQFCLSSHATHADDGGSGSSFESMMSSDVQHQLFTFVWSQLKLDFTADLARENNTVLKIQLIVNLQRVNVKF